ncbi:MAG: hypothetical protein ABII74_08625, partial [Elusimicrobiota bacterium]
EFTKSFLFIFICIKAPLFSSTSKTLLVQQHHAPLPNIAEILLTRLAHHGNFFYRDRGNSILEYRNWRLCFPYNKRK